MMKRLLAFISSLFGAHDTREIVESYERTGKSDDLLTRDIVEYYNSSGHRG